MQAQQILFVEDDAIIGLSTCEFMRGQGVSVLDADNAASAMVVVGRNGYLSGLVTDVDLGAGEDGFAVAHRVRLAYPDLPVVYVSGTAATRHLAEGVADSIFIDKPCHPRQILEALKGLRSARAA